MNNKAIVFGVTPNLIFAVANVIIGIEKHSKRSCYDYYVFVDRAERDVNYKEINAIKFLLNRSNTSESFLLKENGLNSNKEGEGSTIRFLDIEDILDVSSMKNDEGLQGFIKRWSLMPFIKLMLYKFFDERFLLKLGTNSRYESVLWLDCDVLVNGDIEKIFTMGPVAGAWGNYASPFLSNIAKEKVEVKKYSIKPNGGVILYDSAFYRSIKKLFLSAENFESSLLDIIKVLSEANVLGIEEHVINIMCNKLSLSLNVLSDEWNFLPWYSSSLSPIIVHSLGSNKFWNNEVVGQLAFPEWKVNNNIWLSVLLRVGVSSTDINKYDHSFIHKPSFIKDLNDGIYWGKKWGDLCRKIKFSHPLLYSQVCPKSRYFQYYFKADVVPESIHYEILAEHDHFIVALHVEDRRLMDELTIISTLESISKAYSFDLIKTNKVIAISLKVGIDDVCIALNKLIDVSAARIIDIFSNSLSVNKDS